MRAFMADLRQVARTWRRRPAFTTIAVLTLALGIAGTIAMFAVVDAVLLRIPFHDPGRLVTFMAFDPSHASPWEVSYAEIRNWSATSTALDGVAGVSSTNWSAVLDGDPPVTIEYAAVSSTFFEVLDARPLLGRTLGWTDDRPGAPRTLVLAHPLWRGRFASDPSVVGRTIRLSGTPYTVVGVMPPTFLYPSGAQLWTALGPALAEWGRRDGQDYLNASWFGILSGIGRLKSTTTQRDAEADLSRLIHRENLPHARVRVTSMTDTYFGRVRWALIAALAAAFLLLAIACSNVGGMLLARIARQRQEWALRLAIGASTADVVRLATLEAVLIGAAGVAAGLAGTPPVTKFIITLDSTGFLAAYPITIDAWVVAGCIATAAATLLFVSTAPALYAAAMQAREGLTPSLRRPPGADRGRTILLAIEVALTVLLLGGTGVMVRSVIRLGAVDLGFEPDRLLLVTGALPDDITSQQRTAAVDDVLRAIRGVPGIRQVAAVYRAPLQGPIGLDGQLLIEGDPVARESYTRHPAVNDESVTPGYFAVMGIRIVAGREFTDHDTTDRPPVVVVSESLARQLWPGQDPVGRRLFAGFRLASSRDARNDFIWDTVVGVSADVHYREFDRSRFDVYRPAAQAGSSAPVHDLVIRTAGDPAGMAGAIRNLIRRQVPGAAPNIRTMSSMVADLTGTWRMTLTIFATFALFAIALSALGLYGWLSYVVEERNHEIAIRIAVGATARDVVRVVARMAGGVLTAGTIVGVVMFLALGRLVEALVFDVSPRDPIALVSGIVVIAVVGAIAICRPGLRAARVDPMHALRAE
jgi:putative ABC transport system permease protein